MYCIATSHHGQAFGFHDSRCMIYELDWVSLYEVIGDAKKNCLFYFFRLSRPNHINTRTMVYSFTDTLCRINNLKFS